MKTNAILYMITKYVSKIDCTISNSKIQLIIHFQLIIQKFMCVYKEKVQHLTGSIPIAHQK